MIAKVAHQYNKFYLPNIAWLLLISCCLLIFTACSSTKTEKKFRIGFSQCTGSDNWRKSMLESMKRELSFHPGTELLYKDADNNSELQVQQIKELLEQNIDLLIVSPNEAQPLTPIVENVFNKGTPVIITDRKTSSRLYTSFVGADNYEIGKMAGNYVANTLHRKGNVIEVIGLPGSTPAIERESGFSDGLRSYPEIHIIAQVYGNWLKDKASAELLAIKDKLKQCDLIFAHNDLMALGAYEICKKEGIKNPIKFIGVDALPGTGGGIQFVSDKVLDASMLYPTGGEEAIQTALKILNKESFEKENLLQTVVIDSTNVRLMKLQADKINTQQKDIEKQQTLLHEQQRIYNDQKEMLNVLFFALLLVFVLGSISFYALRNNRKANRKLAVQNEEILTQRNHLMEMTATATEATEAKFNFFTNISHEFRTPLTLIIAPLEDTLSSPRLHFTLRNNLELVEKNVFRLLRLVNQLMDFRKIEHGNIKLKATENDIIAFVTDITNAFNEIARKKSIVFKVNTKIRDLIVWFDTNMLDKVIFNLLSNAFKFTNEHGSITVTIDKNSESNMAAVIKVEDTGVGMSPIDVEHAFELFYQGHETTFKGSGLGLALSKELINLHHGTITLESEKWKGSCFTISLPLGCLHLQKEEIFTTTNDALISYDDIKIYTTDIIPAIPPEREKETPVSKEYSILLIEDNEDLTIFLTERLRITYEVFTADNGNSGINLAYETVPDLIICDITLPGQDGLYITNILKNDLRTSHIPIIILTAKAGVDQQIESMKLKADAFILKPFNLQYLEETIKSLLKNRALLREHYTSELSSEMKLAGAPKKLDRKFISEFTAIVENNIANENFSVDTLCKQIGISRVQLYRKIKALLGYNVNDYILNVRLQKARYLLVNQEISISEIAFAVGFASQAYFATVFKSKFNMTPSEFREKANSNR